MSQTLHGTDKPHRTHKFHVSHDPKLHDKVHVEHAGSLSNEETIAERIGNIKKGAMHADLGEPESHKITSGDIAKEKAKGGVYAKRAVFAQNAKKWHHKEETEHLNDNKEEVILFENEHMSDEAHELVMHADNHAQLHHGSHMPIINNLKKKMKKGVYDSEKAKKLWGYHADRAAQSYHKEYGDKHVPWHHMFPTHVRREAAAHWEAHHRDELHESVEHLDELSKKTLGSYVKKASKDAAKNAEDYLNNDAPYKDAEKAQKVVDKRLKGVEKATDKLTKEEIELVDEIAGRPKQIMPTKDFNNAWKNFKKKKMPNGSTQWTRKEKSKEEYTH
jgi:hypothetical protein